MASKKALIASVGVGILAIAGVAFAAQNYEANENSIIGEHSEREIALDEVPEAVMDAARQRLASISEAELVTREADGSTLYEIEGRDQEGNKVELYLTPEGQVLGSEE